MLFFATLKELWVMSSRELNISVVALSVVSLTFFIVGVCAYSLEEDDIRQYSWIRSKDYGDTKVFFGLRGFYGFRNDPLNRNPFKLQYADSDCEQHFCDTCNVTGQNAIGLGVIAVISTTITMALSFVLIFTYSKIMHFTSIATSMCAAVTSVIAVAVFMTDCWNALEKEVKVTIDSSLQLGWGTGSYLFAVGSFLIGLLAILQVLEVAMGGTTPSINYPEQVSVAPDNAR